MLVISIRLIIDLETVDHMNERCYCLQLFSIFIQKNIAIVCNVIWLTLNFLLRLKTRQRFESFLFPFAVSFHAAKCTVKPVHITRVHGPWTRVSKTSTVNTGACPHYTCSRHVNLWTGSRRKFPLTNSTEKEKTFAILQLLISIQDKSLPEAVNFLKRVSIQMAANEDQ